ncbi:DUF4348 domain-containing protein [uncultured Aquimarina sp.]|uniref:DUF4348 domain-containing protein n=1 Tax=uncultured Aquimarina sp. TaxID=575652 RepID=UPI002639B15A|nr:DUF4348 domain-containing protein [uncultured Aquimarina sp.]
MNTLFKTTLLIVLVAFATGCVDKKETNSKDLDIKAEKTNEPVLDTLQEPISDNPIVPKNCGLNFEAFFNRFSKDSVFQKSRVKFPLKMTYFDAYSSDTTTPEEEYIEQQDYQFFNLSNDSEAANRDIDRFRAKIEKKENDTYIYYQLGIDNGIRVEFEFKKENNCWLFVSLKDEST